MSFVHATDSFAQKVEISIDAQNQTVEKVLKEIEKQSGFGFFFNNKHVNLKRVVSVSVDKSNIFKVLDKIFEGTDVKYSVLDKKIILSTEMTSKQQQAVKISGKVVDVNGEPVIGANVVQKGTTNGTITDLNGDFTLTVSQGAVLQVSFIGYKQQEVSLKNGQAQVTVVLKDDAELLDEVVVVGYGTMKKRDLSGAVSQIKSDDLMKGNPTDLSKGLAGKIAGVQVNQSDGAPGGGISIQIRGTNSFSTNSQPLYIVDGVPFDTGDTPASDTNNSQNKSNPLAFINPHDIQSIDVLKDASATAIYGSRGANGVVIITTKRGEKGNEKVEFSANFTFSKIAKRMDVLDAFTYANYQNEQVLNDYKYSNKPYGKLPYPGAWEYPALPGGGNDTSAGKYLPAPEDFLRPGDYVDEYGNISYVGVADWQDLIYQNGFSQEYNISVSGGSDKGWHSFSGNFLKQDGIIKNSGFTRYSLRSNIGRYNQMVGNGHEYQFHTY